MKLLLIDDYVIGYRDLINARKDDVDYLLFNSSSDTYEYIIKNIRIMNTQYTDIAFIQHGYKNSLGLEFLVQEGRMSVYDSEPYPSFDKFKNFLITLKGEFGVERFDLLACSLYVGDKIKKIIEYLEAETGIDLRASSNFTGNAEQGGDWIMESDNVDIRENYFTDAISNFKDILYEYSGGSTYGKNKLVKDTSGNVIYFHREPSLNGTGAPINPNYDALGNQIKYPPCSISNWGATTFYENWSTSNDAFSIAFPNNINDIIAVYSNNGAFVGLRSNNTIVCWGSEQHGAIKEYAELYVGYALNILYYKYSPAPAILNNVKHIYSTERAFAALKYDGTVTVWGNHSFGGCDSPGSDTLNSGTYFGKPSNMQNVESIYSNERVFIALTINGTAYSWGQNFGTDITHGGGITDTNVKAVYTNRYAFCLLKVDGTLKTYGDSRFGGGRTVNTNTLYKCIYSTERAFAGLKTDRTVEVWGDGEYGGSTSGGNSDTANQYSGMPSDLLNSSTANVIEIYSTNTAFLALKTNRQAFRTWGSDLGGGYNAARTSIQSNIAISNSIYQSPPDYSGNIYIASICAHAKAFGFLLQNSSSTVATDLIAFGKSNLNVAFMNISTFKNNYINLFPFKLLISTIDTFCLISNKNELINLINFDTLISDTYYTINSIYSHYRGFTFIKKNGTLQSIGENTQNTPANIYNFINIQPSPTSFVGLRLNPYTLIKSGASIKTPSGNKLIENIVIGDTLSTKTANIKVKYIYTFEIETSATSFYKLYQHPSNTALQVLSSSLIKTGKSLYESISDSKYDSYLLSTSQTNTYYCIIDETCNTTVLSSTNIELITYSGSLSVKSDAVLGIYIEKEKYITFKNK